MAAKESETLVLLTQDNGIVVIPAKTPLTRLNYFDGKFLRASDLKTEQDYLGHLVRQSNQAGGSGVVHGFDLTLGGGDKLDLGPGLAINPDGRVMLLPQGVSLSVQELIEKSQEPQKFFNQVHVVSTKEFEECEIKSATPPVDTTHPNNLYLIVICPAEALCGEEDVYAKLCEEACATSSDRPFAVEGLIVRAVPLVLQTPLPHSKVVSIATKKHLRSRVAAAYFEEERLRVASMISRFGLEQEVWCLGADAATGACLPIGVIAQAGATTLFLDAWIARRERMDTPPRRYWQWRMMMRPWDVFLAQILQFQCQLRDLFGGGLTPDGEDPCGDARTVIGEAAKKLADLIKMHKEIMPQLSSFDAGGQMEVFKAKMVEMEEVNEKLSTTEQQMPALKGNRLLIRGGIIELPSAGYLPVNPDANATVNQQVRQLMGEGVDLRFCVVRPDFVAHALEEAQHMERISLIEGLEDPKKKPQVDILVPDGEIAGAEAAPRLGFAVDAELQTGADAETFLGGASSVPFKGVARAETLPTGGTAFYMSCTSAATLTHLPKDLAVELNNARGPQDNAFVETTRSLALWLTLRSDQDLTLLKPGDKTNVSAEILIGVSSNGISKPALLGKIDGVFTAQAPKQNASALGTIAASFFLMEGASQAKSGNTDFEFFAEHVAGTGIEIEFNSAKVKFTIKADWSIPGKVTGGVGSVIITTKSKSEISLVTTLSSDENVFSPTNADHVLALQALEIIETAVNAPGFVSQKSNLLFPPAEAGPAGGLIRATRDWVLFHRRRNKECEVEVQQPPAVKSVCHTVFRARTVDDFKIAVSSIDSMIKAGGGNINQVIQQHNLLKLGDVLFEEHSAKVFGDGKTLTNVVSGWNQGGIGVASMAAVFSQASPQDAESRKNQANAIVQKINNNVGVVQLDAFTVPASIALPTACPAFSIIAGQQIAEQKITTVEVETCVTVIRVLNQDDLDFLMKEISNGNTNMINVALTTKFGPILGKVLFKKGTKDVAANSLAPLQVKINSENLGTIIEVKVFVVADDSSTEADKAVFQDQTALLRKAFGGAEQEPPPLLTAPLPVEVGCPALVFLAITSKP